MVNVWRGIHVPDTISTSHVDTTSTTAGTAADRSSGSQQQNEVCSARTNTHMFANCPVVTIETMRSWNDMTVWISFVHSLYKRSIYQSVFQNRPNTIDFYGIFVTYTCINYQTHTGLSQYGVDLCKPFADGEGGLSDVSVRVPEPLYFIT
jgi:hypothetical protein